MLLLQRQQHPSCHSSDGTGFPEQSCSSPSAAASSMTAHCGEQSCNLRSQVGCRVPPCGLSGNWLLCLTLQRDGVGGRKRKPCWMLRGHRSSVAQVTGYITLHFVTLQDLVLQKFQFQNRNISVVLQATYSAANVMRVQGHNFQNSCHQTNNTTQ